MSHKVLYAYHVSDVTYCSTKPNWSHLSTTTAIDRYYNGVMGDLISEGVFFSTTLRDGRLPEKSLYPKNGERDVTYWRALVPLSRFNNYRIIRCHSVGTQNGVEQVALLLVPPTDSALNEKVDQAILEGSLEYDDELTHTFNNYLCRDEDTNKWCSNNYNDDLKAWVNIVVPHDVPLGKDTRWDRVQRM